jgi:hypothetical protein
VPEPDLIALFIDPLNRTGIEYMVSGAVAAILYGEPRLTNDIDVVATLDSLAARRLGSEFPSDEFYVPPSEALDEAVAQARHGHFNVIHIASALKVDVYPAGRDPLNAWGLAHRRDLRISGRRVWTAPPEYVILLKLEYWRDGGSGKHVTDIRSILRILGPEIDRDMIEAEANARGLAREWTIAMKTTTADS